jgi:ADP-ribosylglycohydrolase
MALCLAESLIEFRGFDPVDQLIRYTRWWREGYLSSTGECFDIGNTVRTALLTFDHERLPWCGPTEPTSAGNGALMRLAPVPLYYAADPAAAMERAGESSRTTHGAQTSIDACRYFAGLLIGATRGYAKDVLLGDHFTPAEGYWQERPLCPEIDAIAGGSFKQKQPPEIKGTGYVAQSLEAALWAFYHSTDFKDGALLAVNLGEDADTTGAVYGQIAGAHYGERAIPILWRHRLSHRYLIEAYATKLFELS